MKRRNSRLRVHFKAWEVLFVLCLVGLDSFMLIDIGLLVFIIIITYYYLGIIRFF